MNGHTELVKVNRNWYEYRCRLCGTVERIKLPMTARMVICSATAFEERHAACEKREEVTR